MTRRSIRPAIIFAPIVALGAPAAASAHPLGNFTVNHDAGLYVARDAVTIDYVLDMAEIPAFQEISRLDRNGNRQPDGNETATYPDETCEAIRSDLVLQIDGRALAVALRASTVEFPVGAGGLPTLRVTCTFHAPLPEVDDKARLDFSDQSYADRIGWREITVSTEGLSVQGAFASTSVSRRLTAYPDDMLPNPLDERTVALELVFAGESGSASGDARPAAVSPQAPANSRADVFTQLITLQDYTPLTLALALVVSFVWGALHAMSPGHGKTMVAAYLVWRCL